MSGGRRWLAAVLGALLLVPSVGMLVAPHETRSVMERRMLQAAPTWPHTAAGWIALPRVVDAWLKDHMAWRGPMVRAGLQLEAKAGLRPAGALQVVDGKGDWLLLYPGLLAATGAETDEAGARRYADFVCGLAKEHIAAGRVFVFAPAPHTVEIYPEALPDWVPRGAPNQGERVARAVRACGVDAADLKPAMRAAKASGQTLFQHHDSHWTNAGALVAFDALAAAARQPWAIAPADMHWRPGKPFDSDLVRLSGRTDLAQELAPEPPEGYDLAPSTGRLTGIDNGVFEPAFLISGRQAHPVVLIIGDSYTGDFIGQYFRKAGITLAWIHQADCHFDRRIFDRVRPDIVAVMPAARNEACR